MAEIDFPFSGGVDEKTQSQLVEPGAALTISNLRQRKNGSYQKHPGHAAVGNATLAGGTVPTCKRLMSYKDELLQTDGLNLYSRSATANAWTKAGGLVPQASVSNLPTMALQYNVQSYDVVSLNGYYVVAACMPTVATAAPTYNGFATVIDAASGATVAAPAVFMSGSASTVAPKFRLVTVGNLVVAIYNAVGFGAPTSLFYSYIDLTSNVTIAAGWQIVGAALITDTDASGNPPFDACTVVGGTTFVVAYSNSTVSFAINTITVRAFNASFVQTATNDIAAGVNPWAAAKCMSISGAAGDVIFVAYPYAAAKDLRIIGLNPSTLATTATAAVMATVGGTTTDRVAVTRTGTGVGWVVFTDGGGATGAMYTRAFSVSGGAIVATGSSVLKNFRMNLDSRPFVANGRVYCTARPYQQLASYNLGSNSPYASGNELLVLDLTQSTADRFASISQGYLRVAASISPRLIFPVVGNDTPNQYPVSVPTGVISISSTKVLLGVAVLKSASSSSLDLVTLDWSATGLSQPSSLNQGLALAGGLPSFYDGVRVAEIGFLTRSVITSTSFSGTGLSPSTGYRYIVVDEQIDARGQWHQGNVSDPSALVVPVDQGVIVNTTTLQCTNRADVNNTAPPGTSIARKALYRTTDGGTIFFRVSSDPGNVHCTVMNNPNSSTVAFPVDTLPDVSLGAPLYTQPGIPGVAQVRVSPPNLCPLITHADRLVGANGKDVWFSGQSVYGEGYWFADAFQFTVESGGDITALASLDGSLVVFKRDKIAFVDGSGPPDNGAGGDFSLPQFIAADVGCIEPRSVVVTPAGVMFQSLRGIELLSRGRSLASYFGSHVEDTLAANPVITSAVLDEAKGIVTFTCLTSETASTGVLLVWDYVNRIWTTSTLSTGVGFGYGAKSAVMWGQNFGTVPVRTWLDSVGGIYQESTSTYLDVGAYVTSTIVTPWIKMAGLQGYGRTQGLAILMTNPSPCNVTVTVEVDYRSGVVQTRTFTAAEIALLRIPQVYMTMKVQKCESFRLTIAETAPTGGPAVGTGQGAVFVGLRIEYSQKKGINKQTAAGN